MNRRVQRNGVALLLATLVGCSSLGVTMSGTEICTLCRLEREVTRDGESSGPVVSEMSTPSECSDWVESQLIDYVWVDTRLPETAGQRR